MMGGTEDVEPSERGVREWAGLSYRGVLIKQRILSWINLSGRSNA